MCIDFFSKPELHVPDPEGYGVGASVVGDVLQSRGDLLQSQEEWAHASVCYEEAVPLYRIEQDGMGLCYTLAELLFCKMRLGEEEAVRELAGEIMELLPGQTESVQGYVLQKLFFIR